jgi:glutathione S-transferase
VRAIALAIACDIHPLDNTRVLAYLEGIGLDQDARDTWYKHWITLGFDAIEPQLAARASGPLLFRRHAHDRRHLPRPQVANSQRFKMPLERWPRIRAINEACLKVPAFDLAQPKRQPDADSQETGTVPVC